MADSFPRGWETIRQYENNWVARDNEDETKIFKAENRSTRKQKTSGRSKGVARPRENPAYQTGP